MFMVYFVLFYFFREYSARVFIKQIIFATQLIRIITNYKQTEQIMNKKINVLLEKILKLSASLKGLGIHLIRVAIFIIFIWIGGLKFFNYEAEGIVPFVANSPFRSFLYTKQAPE